MVMVHGSMLYKCERCGDVWNMWLEEGVEDFGVYGRKHQPCPFVIRCDCGGNAKHIEMHKDHKLTKLRPIAHGMRYFAYDSSGEDLAHGIPCRYLETCFVLKGERND